MSSSTETPNLRLAADEGSTMRVMLLSEFGQELYEHQMARPEPARGEVLVRIAASGVNPLDLKIKAGEAAHAKVTPPFVLGIDLAGTVEAVGVGVDGFQVGDQVYGMTGGVGDRQGSLAEYASVDARLLAQKPNSISMREAAALPLAAISAWEGLVDRASVGPGDTVLVLGGAGGVGSLAIQLALSRGATVYATASTRSFNFIRELGAQPLDREIPLAEHLAQATGGAGFDIVFDAVGGAVLGESFGVVRRYSGRVVSILGWGTQSLAPLSFRGASYSGVFTLLPLLTGEGLEHHGEILREISSLVDAGAIAPKVSAERFDWMTIADAHDAAAAGRGGGKIVIDIGQ